MTELPPISASDDHIPDAETVYEAKHPSAAEQRAILKKRLDAQIAKLDTKRKKQD